MEIALNKDDVVKSLWLAYKKTPEFGSGMKMAIPAMHPLVEKQEKEGVKQIYRKFIANLNSYTNARQELRQRSVAGWITEWKEMNKILFQHILKECGGWRTSPVRFGNPGDEDLHHIPQPHNIPSEIASYAKTIGIILNANLKTDAEKFKALATVHYQFVRIHPFSDGNGRIARAITDQVSMFFGFPPAMAGYPRHDPHRRESYHQAINACIYEPSYDGLSGWIASYITKQLEQMA